ncbi:asparagine synthase (glutamine-hydrolyzing) [Algoriphagus sp.]|jgi:asparagine synthase (glutamine-hydrolysing)|uniref:asparagine synthase (glutamine-hydrolyzing) n=1 Tax=Algoriphagus sp. TaxID=1872435 RepID=UPI00271CE180|nr:asparagine synthase (glutamine-hydrolyzing) [Algoriphagus sp.]MDO8968923.1 asparagine synthase (glutamine-hydrolyzing) [Algoriphagus sp.]MDP3202077.1 asparagine synthase (glutamine-hydrolyzing) [Algoriphagus sp.]
MCGIHLIWGKKASKKSIQALVDATHHRGPDQSAIYSPWNGLWIGVNRLKILHHGPDADQPFWAPDGNSLLILNGEIYNFQELRRLLTKMGIEFITQSDTEVLLHYLKIFGQKGLEKLNGMFSIIYIDLISKSVLVARDRNGEKPLYYAQSPDNLVISSELRGITAFQAHVPDWDQVDHYFYFRAPAPGKTFHRGISAWKPGRYSTLFRHDTFRWDTLPVPQGNNEPPSQTSFAKLLEKTVLNQFHADVPVGLLLSGGADSSLLYSLWYRKTGTSLPAYTIQVEKKYRSKYADGDQAIRFSKQIPTDHHLIDIDQKAFLENWEEYIRSVDLPIGDSAGFLTWMIGKKAKSEVKVLISGAGSDELWGGYQRHAAFDKYLQLQRFWCKWADYLKKLPFGKNWKKFTSGIQLDPNTTFLNFSALQNPPTEMIGDYERIFNPKLPVYKRMLDFDRQVYLVQDVLKVHDNALMAHGIEGRSPYLDSSLLGLWQRVEDPALLLGKPWIKNLLRENELGWVADRKKFGFGLPLQEWLNESGELSKRVFATLKEFDKTQGENFSDTVRQILRNPESGVKTQFLTLYNLFLLAEWSKLRL